jgi:hypothetical protein
MGQIFDPLYARESFTIAKLWWGGLSWRTVSIRVLTITTIS